MLGLQNEREWGVFCERVLQAPELASDPRFSSNSRRTDARDALRAIIVDAFRPLTAAEVVARLDAAGIANARMNDMHDVWNHPQLAARHRWADVDTPAGRIPAPVPPGMEPAAARMDPVPALGQHTQAILRRTRLRRRTHRAAARRQGHLMNALNDPGADLAAFASGLQFEDIPASVIARAEDLFLDWVGSALAGKGARAVESIERFARSMGPATGPAEVLITRRTTTPYFAAMVNAAASHVVEQDDVHNGSVFHPGTVVFPPALAVAQTLRASGRAFLAAAVAGYEVGIRVGEFLGRSHYKVFHTTGTAGTLAAAVTVGRLLELDAARMRHAMGSAGTQAAGLWEFLRDAADSKQLHTAKAAADGLLAAYLAQDGFTGARRILDGTQGMAAGMSRDADPARLVDRLGTRWALAETSFKFHASCRHTHPAADALLQVVSTHDLAPRDIRRVTAFVHQGAIDVLGPVVDPVTVHQAKFSMGTVLGLIARYRKAGLREFETAFRDPDVVRLRDVVRMVHDAEVDAAYPQRWIGKVEVETVDGRVLQGRVDEPKGDPGNTLSRTELVDKAVSLASFSGAASASEMQALAARIFALPEMPVVGSLLDGTGADARERHEAAAAS